jgi:hypothetical protein
MDKIVLGIALLAMTLACGEASRTGQEAAETAVEGLDGTKQQQTMNDIRVLGQGLLAWSMDQTGAAAAGQRQVAVEAFPEVLDGAELRRRLSPRYLPVVPTVDGWGHPLEVRLGTRGAVYDVLLIRSPGRDGTFDADAYRAGTFPSTAFDEDIVWLDQGFVRSPR